MAFGLGELQPSPYELFELNEKITILEKERDKLEAENIRLKEQIKELKTKITKEK